MKKGECSINNKESRNIPLKTAKKGITVRFEQDEYNELLKQVKSNHYSSVNEYIRDCVFNKTTILEDYNSKQEICAEFEKCRKQMIQTEGKLDKLLLYSVNDEEIRERFEDLISTVRNDRKQLEISLNTKLFKNFIKEKEVRELEENNHRKVD